MLTVEQQGYATWLISEDERQVTQLSRFAATPFLIDGDEYRFGQDDGPLGPRDTLEGPLGVTAVAYSSGHREVTVDSTPHRLVLRRLTRLGRRWEVDAFEQRVGTCRISTFSATGDLPAELPLPLRVFVLRTALMHSDGSVLSFLPWF